MGKGERRAEDGVKGGLWVLGETRSREGWKTRWRRRVCGEERRSQEERKTACVGCSEVKRKASWLRIFNCEVL
jgi:hypothetical protein